MLEKCEMSKLQLQVLHSENVRPGDEDMCIAKLVVLYRINIFAFSKGKCLLWTLEIKNPGKILHPKTNGKYMWGE